MTKRDLDKRSADTIRALKCCPFGPGVKCEICAYGYDKSELYRAALEIIEAQQDMIESAQPQKAEWIYDRPHHYYCSNCAVMWGESAKSMHYCPSCGAKMHIKREITSQEE